MIEIKKIISQDKKFHRYIIVTACIYLIIVTIFYYFEKKENHITGLQNVNITLIAILFLFIAIILVHGIIISWIYHDNKNTKKAFLQKSNELEQFFANSIDMLCIADTNGIFIRLNPEWNKILGYNIQELEGKPFINYVHPDDVEKTKEATRKLAGRQKILNFINRYQHKNGTYRWIEWRAYPVEKMIYASARDISEKKQAEIEKQENIDRAQAFADATYEGIVISDNGIVIEANQQFLNILGFNNISEIIGKSILDDFTPPESQDMVKQHIRDNNSEHYESTSYRKDKSVFPVEIRGRSMILKGKQMRVTTIRDLTDIKVAEQEIRENDLWLRESQHSSHIGSYNFSIVTGIWKSSEELDKIFGIQESYNKTIEGWMQIIHPDHQHEMSDHLLNHVIGQYQTFNKEYRIIRQNDGETRWVYGLGNLYFDKDGNPAQMIGTIQDITDRKKAEEALVESESKARLFVEYTPLPVAMFDTEMRYIMASKRWNTDYRLGNQEIIGRSHYDIFPEIGEKWKNDHRRVLAGEIYKMDADKFERADGSVQWLRYELHPWRKSNGQIGGLVMFTEDITDRIITEIEIKNLNSELEKRVLDRTVKLERANKDLESFAYSVSHDLRAPLRHVDGFVRLMYQKIELPAEIITNYYEKINAASKRMSGMIDDLLAFSRLGRKELNLSAVNFTLLVNEIIEQLKPDISNRQIQWIIHPLPSLTCDKNLLKLAMENLISNAIKYTSRKQVAIIEIGSSELPDNKVDIFIKDNGVGFNMVYVGKLFGVFQRLHSTEEFEGTGIGLANVKQIILRHKGSVKAEGKIDEGAIFYITLPK